MDEEDRIHIPRPFLDDTTDRFLFTVVSVVALELAGYSVFFVEPLIIR